MATTSVDISIDADGNSLAVLSDLIAKRAEFLRDETTEKAVTATTINVVTSLKADTKKAPLKAKPEMYRITQIGDVGWRGPKGSRRRTAIVGDHRVKDVYPVNLMYGLKGAGFLYRIELENPNLTPKISKNKPVYIVMAPNFKVAEDYAKARVSRALGKESGMARYALGMAQARVSDRPMQSEGLGGSHAMQVAAQAANVTKDAKRDSFSIDVNDELRYSIKALKSGDSALSNAIKKAANRTAAIINKLGTYRLHDPIPTPFPEVGKPKS